MRLTHVITVVGIGADGWDGLPENARAVILDAEVVLGGERQLDLVPGGVKKVAWPSPLLPALDGLLAEHEGARVCVLASGDPLLYGIGATLVRRLGADRVRVVPSVSSVSLAGARMGWPADEIEVVSVVGRAVHRVSRVLAPGQKIAVLSADATTPAAVAGLLTERGYGASRVTVLEELGGPHENRRDGTAADWTHPPGAALNVLAVDCAAGTALSRVPGLPDEAFEHDGQLTKRDIRTISLARLAPLPGELLWDVGAGAGSVAIEWLRVHPRNRAIAVERNQARVERIRRNAERLGVPELEVVDGEAPAILDGLTPPDAVFVGGGVSALERCWDALRRGGRLVANAVTVESEIVLANAYTQHGGELVRLAVQHAGPLGGFTGWTPARTVTQWSVTKA